MIILLSDKISNEEINTIYDQQMKRFKSKEHLCTNCKKMIFYTKLRTKPRKILTKEGITIINIEKYKCPICHCEHTILIDSMIPFCFYTVPDYINIIIQSYEGNTIPNILEEYISFDENTFSHILKKYKNDWQDKITIHDLKTKNIPKLSLQNYHKQFLQGTKDIEIFVYDFAQEDWLYLEMSNKIKL